MAFEGLSEKLNGVFKRLRGKGRLTEADVREGMREVRLALLEADVSYKVVKDFVASVTEKCVGADVARDGKIITGRAAGAALDFGLELLKALRGEKAAREIAGAIVYER